MKEIAVLLTVHNRKEKTLKCLEDLYSNRIPDGFRIEVFLTDDGCKDGTPEAIKKVFPQIHILQGDGNLYWNRGMLLAWEYALNHSDCEAVIWLNDDTYLFPNAIEVIVEKTKRYPDSIIVGTISSRNGIITYGGYKNGNILLHPNQEEIECDYFNGNVVYVPRSVSDKIGLLDRKFIHRMGDFEYGRRAKRCGVSSYVLPAIGVCERNSSYTKWTDTAYSPWMRLKLLYSPLGYNPFQAFHLERGDSMVRACLVFVYLHMKALFPTIFRDKHVAS